jgi:hypothetical protein
LRSAIANKGKAMIAWVLSVILGSAGYEPKYYDEVLSNFSSFLFFLGGGLPPPPPAPHVYTQPPAFFYGKSFTQAIPYKIAL